MQDYLLEHIHRRSRQPVALDSLPLFTDEKVLVNAYGLCKLDLVVEVQTFVELLPDAFV